jgi:hypothetical protein
LSTKKEGKKKRIKNGLLGAATFFETKNIDKEIIIMYINLTNLDIGL